jgi:lipopolysaccharide transport system ATP-binding protein
MKRIIEVKNISKKYRYGLYQHYGTLRDSLSGLLRVPKTFLKHESLFLKKGEFWALKNVSFEVGQGEVLGVIGPNGSGKSTLLKILSQITPPTRGEALIRGRVASLLEVGTGFHQELTGRENIYLNGSILGMTHREIKKKFNEIVDFSGIEKFLDTPVKYYSSGMYLRLAFSIAAYLEPEILLVDEVLAVGDYQFQKKCLGKIEEVAEGGRTVIFVSHQLPVLENLCKRGLLLKGGSVEFVGSIRDAVLRYLKGENRSVKIDLSRRVDRSGLGHFRFVNTWVEDTEGKKVLSLNSGRGCRLVAEYEVSGGERLSKMDFGFTVNTFDGLKIFNLKNEYQDLSSDEKIGRSGRVVCTIKQLPLTPNSYVYSLYAYSPYGLEDFISQAGNLEIGPGIYSGEQVLPDKDELLSVNYEWDVTRRR